MKKTYQTPAIERVHAELTHCVCTTVEPKKNLGSMHNIGYNLDGSSAGAPLKTCAH